MEITQQLIDLFESRVQRTEGGCWGFRGSDDGNGYERVRHPLTKKWIRATHLSWMIFKGPIPVGQFPCHKCDSPQCCNYEHLFLGGHAENRADCKVKGRHAFGERHGHAKITEATALKIREYLLEGEFQLDISRELGVSKSVVVRISGNYDWTHLGPPIRYKRKPAALCKLREKFRTYKIPGYLEKLRKKLEA